MPMPVKPIPEGQRSVTPHLTVSDAGKAVEFYKAAFGAEERNRAATPDGKIMHTEIRIGDSNVYLNDPFGPPGPPPAGVVIHLYVADADVVWARALKAGATVKMPIMDAFWGDRYGQLTDPFGHTWGVSTHKEDVAPEEVAKRAQAYFSKMGG